MIIYGVDPGLVDTGIVKVVVDKTAMTWVTSSIVLRNATAQEVVDAIGSGDLVFVEDYKPRNNFGTGDAMSALCKEIKFLEPKVRMIDNTGIKRLVPAAILEELELWRFPTTHHRDLQSAARVLVRGLMTSPGNLLRDVVRDRLEDQRWQIWRETP